MNRPLLEIPKTPEEAVALAQKFTHDPANPLWEKDCPKNAEARMLIVKLMQSITFKQWSILLKLCKYEI